MIRKKHKKICTTLYYIEHFLISASAITGCILIFAFTSLIYISTGITSCAVQLNLYAITAVIKSYMSTIKTKKKKHDKIVLL